jgi:hypothetical protein
MSAAPLRRGRWRPGALKSLTSDVGNVVSSLRRRKSVVTAVLKADARFEHEGAYRTSRWVLASLDVEEWAVRCECDLETAREIFFGPNGFEERGYVARLNGNGRVVPTRVGLMFGRYVVAGCP